MVKITGDECVSYYLKTNLFIFLILYGHKMNFLINCLDNFDNIFRKYIKKQQEKIYKKYN